MNTQIIKVIDLSKSFKRIVKQSLLKDLFNPKKETIEAVKHISFNINKGESVAFLGPNGAGKTTTIKMLTGLIYPTFGEIDILNFKPFDKKAEYLMKIGLVMGNKAGLNWDLTSVQSFELLKHIYKIPTLEFNSRIEELTNLLDAQNFLNTQVRKLSLGERMKMEIIGAILHNPDILFLDEPTIGLDIISKQKIREFLRKIQIEKNVTLLLTSHDMDDIEEVCDRVIVINHGQKIYDDSIDKLTAKYSKFKFIKVIFKKSFTEFLNTEYEILEKGKNSLRFKVPRESLSKFMTEVTQKYEIDDIDISSVPLEEIIADLFRNA